MIEKKCCLLIGRRFRERKSQSPSTPFSINFLCLSHNLIKLYSSGRRGCVVEKPFLIRRILSCFPDASISDKRKSRSSLALKPHNQTAISFRKGHALGCIHQPVDFILCEIFSRHTPPCTVVKKERHTQISMPAIRTLSM